VLRFTAVNEGGGRAGYTPHRGAGPRGLVEPRRNLSSPDHGGWIEASVGADYRDREWNDTEAVLPRRVRVVATAVPLGSMRKPGRDARDSAWLADRPRVRARLCGLVLVAATTPSTVAEPWVGPGDVRLRHDLQRLADAGLLTGPTLSWPIAWSQVARELGALDADGARRWRECRLERLRARAAREMRPAICSVWRRRCRRPPTRRRCALRIDPARGGRGPPGGRLGRPALRLEACGDGRCGSRRRSRRAARRVLRRDEPRQLDGLGGYLERWWGPGWQGSLILGSNARPLPSIALDRNESTPFDVPVLRWLGPWRFSTFMGQFESDRDYRRRCCSACAPRSPAPTLQVAASRTAQWCGDGRPCDLDTFWDLLAGNDNDQDLAEQPGNQLAGFDLRWSWPGARVPLALYAQAIGEDEAGFMPSKYLGLFGLEVWGDLAGGSWRVHAEYADTACDFLSAADFGCAYTNGIYTSRVSISRPGPRARDGCRWRVDGWRGTVRRFPGAPLGTAGPQREAQSGRRRAGAFPRQQPSQRP
jgi:hypothetical protein